MYFALDKDKNRVFINDVDSKSEYFCQLCGNRVILKRGSIKAHHFAHQMHTACDGWTHEMSEWHLDWQSMFPIECREVVLEKDGKKHIADVLVGNTVFEFQHSPLSPEEFDDRNDFYTSLGYKLIWIFDLNEEAKNGRIKEHDKKENVLRWKYPKRTFTNFDLRRKDVHLFFEMGLTDEGYESECKYIARVVWASEKGFEWFAIDIDHIYNENDIVELSGKPLKKPSLEDLSINMYDGNVVSKGHAHIFYGCPISKNGYAASNDIDMLSKEGYGICQGCEYYADSYRCNYYIANNKIPKNAIILDIKKDANGRLLTVSFQQENQYKTVKFEAIKPTISSIFILWNNLTKPKYAIFHDIKSDFYLLITKNPNEQFKKYHKIYGIFSRSRDSFKSDSKSVSFPGDMRWECVKWETIK